MKGVRWCIHIHLSFILWVSSCAFTIVGDRPYWNGSFSAKSKVWMTCVIPWTFSEQNHHCLILQVSHMSFGPCWTNFLLNAYVSSFSLIPKGQSLIWRPKSKSSHVIVNAFFFQWRWNFLWAFKNIFATGRSNSWSILTSGYKVMI